MELLDIEKYNDDIIAGGSGNLFFVESSGRDHLGELYACAVESASGNAGVKGLIVVVMTSKVLNLKANPATEQIYKNREHNKVVFRHVNVDTLFKGTPIDRIHQDKKLESLVRRNEIAQYSDVIRMILIYKFGGWYSDLDMIFTKNLPKDQNVIASDSHRMGARTMNTPDYNHDDYGDRVSNAIFHNEKGHKFLSKAIELFQEEFVPDRWASSGPAVLQASIDNLCGVGKVVPMSPKIHNAENCQGMKVVHPMTFYPSSYYETFIHHPRPSRYWAILFKDSVTVHFYGSSSGTESNVKNFREGEQVTAFNYLAHKHCPATYKTFLNHPQ